MNTNRRQSGWKWYLAAGAVLIVSLTLWYNRYLALELTDRENQQAAQFAEALRSIGRSNMTSDSSDVGLELMVITQNSTVPVVLLDEDWKIQEYRNIGDNTITEMDTGLVRAALNQMIEKWADTIEISAPPYFRNYLIYSHSNLLARLYWYPYIQLLLIAAFIGLGYIGFSASRQTQENQVWLGMAKETAHQLGTPITALMGWLETLKLVNEDNPTTTEMLVEMDKDIIRLELVADRFSKIGATPELSPENIYEALERCRAYMQRRAPRKVKFDFPVILDHAPLLVNINGHLFDWVIENLLRNAIDAMENGQGNISAVVYQEINWVCFDITDTGKGIPSSKYKTVFQPGFSTKSRGWGLGLSLSKRIIDNYHGGKILVKKSEIGKGTTFTVKLPV